MDAVIVSDVHCDGPESATQRDFLRFLAGCTAPTLVLAGDVFHAFGTTGGRPFSRYQPVLDALAGFELVVLPGNHDWLLPGCLPRARRPTVAHPDHQLDLALGGLRCRLSHGDCVDTSIMYRLSHVLFRSRLFEVFVDNMSDTSAWAFLHRLAGPLGAGAPNPKLVEAQHTRAARWLAEGAELVVMGHTHAPECVDLPGGTFLNPGDWVRHRSYGVITGRRVELLRFEP